MAETGMIKRGHELSKVMLDSSKPDDNCPATTLFDSNVTIGGKQLSY